MVFVFDETNFLDWSSILINEVIGSFILFVLLGIIIISILCALNKVSFGTSVTVLVLWVLICLSLVYLHVFLVIVILIAAGLFVTAAMKIVNMVSR